MNVRFLAALCAALAIAPAARAGDNDLQLFRLGHPDDITICTRCDGNDRAIEPGDPGAQARFHRLASTLGLLLVPPMFAPAGTTGQSGFEIGFTGNVAILRLTPSEWPTAGTQAVGAVPRALFLPTVSVRKGLGGSVEIGAAASMVTGSQIFALTAELRWALIDGLEISNIPVPDLALRVHATRALGTQELDLFTTGADAVLSYRFALGGMVKIQPYVQGGIALVNAATGVIDFHPQTEDPRDPTADDKIFHNVNLFHNRYLRMTGGLRVIAGAVLLAGEWTFSRGTNPVQSDSLQSGAEPPSQKVETNSVSGRIGFVF